MADQKSKLPDFNEITSMMGKLFRDVKTSIGEIVDEYKAKHNEPDVQSCEVKQTTTTTTTTTEVPVAPKATTTSKSTAAPEVKPVKPAKVKIQEVNVEVIKTSEDVSKNNDTK